MAKQTAAFSGASLAGLVKSATSRALAAEREAEPMLHAAIEASGLQQEAARRFGAQGEGAIAGRWLEYAVASLDEHHRFRYARLTCDRGVDGERAAAAQIMGTAQVETQTA